MFTKKLLSITLLSSALLFAACEDDDDDNVTPMSPSSPSPSLSVSDQIASRNSITVSEVTVDGPGWLVVHRDNGNNGPVVPAIISTPTALSSGSNSNVKVEIPNVPLSDGETIWVMVHTDDGDGLYEFDTNQNTDGPVTVDGNILMSSIVINSPKVVASNQTIMNNKIVIDRVEAAVDGWLVIHHRNDTSAIGLTIEPIAGKIPISAGVSTNLSIDLSADSTYSAGYKLYPMLHINGDGDANYDFPGGSGMDLPEIFSNAAFPQNVILTEVTAQ
jgi:hypothetical protein